MTSRTADESPNPVRHVLLGLYDKLSSDIAGGSRSHPEDLRPEAQDPLEGLIPDEFLPDVSTFDWFQPADWPGLDPGNTMPGIDLASIPAPATGGVNGKGLDFFRGGEAPANYSNRNNPLYRARAEFAKTMNGRIEQLFGVKGGGVGYYRPPSKSDAAAGGRSSNSDHYSAGAVDYYGTPEQLDRLREWLVQQPFVSFVRWRSESHHDHLHASFDLGWVAKNYYTGRQIPTVSGPPPSQTTTSAPQTAPTAPPQPEPVTREVGPR